MSLKCLSTTCDLGLANELGVVEVSSPACVNALLLADKEGFYGPGDIVSTNELGVYTLVMDRVYPVEVDVMVVDQGGVRPLQPTEQAFVYLEHDNGYAVSVVAPGHRAVDIIPGTYTVRSELVVGSDPPFVLQGKKEKVCHDVPREGVLGIVGLTERKCVEHEISDVELSQVAAGGSEIIWTAAHEQLAFAKKLTLFVIRSSVPRTVDELINAEEVLGEHAKNSRKPVLQ